MRQNELCKKSTESKLSNKILLTNDQQTTYHDEHLQTWRRTTGYVCIKLQSHRKNGSVICMRCRSTLTRALDSACEKQPCSEKKKRRRRRRRVSSQNLCVCDATERHTRDSSASLRLTLRQDPTISTQTERTIQF